jgi:hypothetical protein
MLVFAVLSMLVNVVEFSGLRGLPFLVDKLAYSDTPFDSSLWHESPEPQRAVYPSPRFAMARCLVGDELERGMTKARIEALLGPPDTVWSCGDADSKTAWEYCLGAPFADMPYKDWYLFLHFGADGRYTGYSTYHDDS